MRKIFLTKFNQCNLNEKVEKERKNVSLGQVIWLSFLISSMQQINESLFFRLKKKNLRNLKKEIGCIYSDNILLLICNDRIIRD